MIPKSTNPLLIFGTRHGTIYNLTPFNLPQISSFMLSYGDLHDYTQTFSKLPEGMSFKKFFNYPENSLVYLAPYDLSKPDCMNGCQNNSKVKIKSNKGYTQITAQLYDQMIDLIKPDIYVGLTQYPSLEKDHKSESNKSHKRAICKTKSYLEKSKLTQSQQNDKHEGTPLRLAAVHGGKNLSLINRSLEQVLDHAIDGIVLCDLCENQTLEEREEVYKTLIKRLEQENQREKSYFHGKKIRLCLAGQGKIEDINHAIKFGFEMFEVNYPFLIAEQQKALIMENGSYLPKDPVKNQDLRPLDPECQCHTCLNHSEAYIAHLIECHELNAKILLSIHNISVYQKWMKSQ